MYAADVMARSIRKITPDGTQTLLAGSGFHLGPAADGAGSEARFGPFSKIFLDPAGNVLVSGGTEGLRKVTPAGVVTTLRAPENSLWHVADSAGNLYGTDGPGTHVIRLTPGGELGTVAGSAASEGVRLGALPGSLGRIEDIAVMVRGAGANATRLLLLSEGSVLLVTIND